MFQQLRILALMLMGALPVMGVALYAVLSVSHGATDLPPAWLMLAQVAAGMAVHFFTQAAGYRTRPLASDTSRDDALVASRLAFQSGMVKRFAFAEAIAILSVFAAFTVDRGGFLGYVTGALVSLALMALHVWPTPATVDRVQASLERDGARSHLREALGLS